MLMNNNEYLDLVQTIKQEIQQAQYKVHSAVLSGRWCGDQRPLCGPAAGECQSVEFGFITTV